MLIVTVNGTTAWWDDANDAWGSERKAVSDFLDALVPWDVISQTDIVYRKGGAEGVILRELKKLLGDAVTVLTFQPPEPPEEEEGVLV